MTSTNTETEIREVISKWAAITKVSGETGKQLLQPTLATALRESGYTADEEDQKKLLAGMPVWRSNDDNAIEQTRGRRRVDIVVYRGSSPVALIETESDLNDLRTSGVTRRDGHYDVWSSARNAVDSYFDSYKSLERMAAAAFYWNQYKIAGSYPLANGATQSLEAIQLNACSDHNPDQLALFLVSASCRAYDQDILTPRLRSLGAHLICISAR